MIWELLWRRCLENGTLFCPIIPYWTEPFFPLPSLKRLDRATLLDTVGGFHPPNHSFKITLITSNYASRNSLTFPGYILSKFEFFVGGTTLRPPGKCWDLFFKNWLKDFCKWHYLVTLSFSIAKSFYTNKMKNFAKLELKKLRFDRVMNFFDKIGSFQTFPTKISNGDKIFNFELLAVFL